MNDSGIASKNLLDELDVRIMGALKSNPKATNRALARDLGIAQSTVGLRLRNLEATRALKLTAAVDLGVAGFDLFVVMGLRVNQRLVQSVATELASIPEVIYLYMVTGQFDLSTMIACRDRAHMREIIERRISKIPGLISSQADIALDVRRYGAHLKSQLDLTPARLELAGVDDLDRLIIDSLLRDARISLSEVARQGRVADGTVRQRLKSLEDRGLIRFRAVSDPTILGRSYLGWVGLEVAPARLEVVSSKIMRLGEVIFLSYTLGVNNLLMMIALQERDVLQNFLSKSILQISGVERAQTNEIVAILKHDERWLLSNDEPLAST